MDIYRSTTNYNALPLSEANHDALLEWGVDTTTFMTLDTMTVVRDPDMGVVVAIIDNSTFETQFQLLSEEPPAL